MHRRSASSERSSELDSEYSEDWRPRMQRPMRRRTHEDLEPLMGTENRKLRRGESTPQRRKARLSSRELRDHGRAYGRYTRGRSSRVRPRYIEYSSDEDSDEVDRPRTSRYRGRYIEYSEDEPLPPRYRRPTQNVQIPLLQSLWPVGKPVAAVDYKSRYDAFGRRKEPTSAEYASSEPRASSPIADPSGRPDRNGLERIRRKRITAAIGVLAEFCGLDESCSRLSLLEGVVEHVGQLKKEVEEYRALLAEFDAKYGTKHRAMLRSKREQRKSKEGAKSAPPTLIDVPDDPSTALQSLLQSLYSVPPLPEPIPEFQTPKGRPTLPTPERSGSDPPTRHDKENCVPRLSSDDAPRSSPVPSKRTAHDEWAVSLRDLFA